MTLNSTLSGQQQELASITNYVSRSQQSQSQEKTGQKSIDSVSASRLGDIAEHFVIYHAMRRGADVFPSSSCVGKTDLILKIEENLYEFDVKVAFWYSPKSRKKPYWLANHCSEVKPPIWAIVVEPRKPEWRIRWPYLVGGADKNRPKCPKGLENFWNEITN